MCIYSLPTSEVKLSLSYKLIIKGEILGEVLDLRLHWFAQAGKVFAFLGLIIIMLCCAEVVAPDVTVLTYVDKIRR